MIAPSSYNKLFELPMWETSSGGICKLLIQQKTADFVMKFRRFSKSIYVHLWNYDKEQLLLGGMKMPTVACLVAYLVVWVLRNEDAY